MNGKCWTAQEMAQKNWKNIQWWLIRASCVFLVGWWILLSRKLKFLSGYMTLILRDGQSAVPYQQRLRARHQPTGKVTVQSCTSPACTSTGDTLASGAFHRSFGLSILTQEDGSVFPAHLAVLAQDLGTATRRWFIARACTSSEGWWGWANRRTFGGGTLWAAAGPASEQGKRYYLLHSTQKERISLTVWCSVRADREMSPFRRWWNCSDHDVVLLPSLALCGRAVGSTLTQLSAVQLWRPSAAVRPSFLLRRSKKRG